MITHRLGAEYQPFSDLHVIISVSNQLQNLMLSGCKLVKRLRWCIGGQFCQVLQDSASDSWTKNHATYRKRLNGSQQLRLIGIYEKVTAGPGPYGRKDGDIIFKNRHDQNGNMWTSTVNTARGINAVDNWHHQIHENHVGIKCDSQLDGFRA